MSVTLRELFDSRSFDLNAKDGSATFHYFAQAVGEANPEDAVYRAVLGNTTLAPFVWNNLVRGRPSASPLGGGWYDVRLPYRLPDGLRTSDPGAPPPPSGGEPASPPPQSPRPDDPIDHGYSVELSPKPPRLFRSLKTVVRASPNGLPEDYGGFINVKADRSVEGVELPDPTVRLNLDRTFDSMTWGYLDRVLDCCWRTNAAPFANRPAGELVLLGLSIRVAKSGRVSASFALGVDKGEKDVPYGETPGGAPLTIDRLPWHYLWFSYVPAKPAGAPVGQRVGLQVSGVYLEQLLKPADYSVLGVEG